MTESAFCQSVPLCQRAWDATSLQELLRCPRRYYYRIAQGWQPTREAPPLSFGALYHSALEVYDKHRVLGHDWTTSVREAVRHALEGSVEWPESEWLQMGEKIRNRFTLVRSVVWYCDHFAEDPAEIIALPSGEPAVELSFRMELPIQNPDGEPYLLCGHLDGVAQFGNELFVKERKHTLQSMGERYFERFSPDTQVSCYTLATKVVLDRPADGVMIDAAQIGANFTRFRRHRAHRTKAQLNEWLDMTCRAVKRAEEHAVEAQRLIEERQRPEGGFPISDQSCNLFGGCPFRPICSRDPAVRHNFLKADFGTHQWNPLANR